MQTVVAKIINNIRVDAHEAFDRNFERKSFFNTAPWAETKRPVARGSLLNRSGAMRSSLSSKVQGWQAIFSSSVAYFEIHNNGGEIQRVSTRGKSYKIVMPQRQVVGHHVEVDRIVQENIDAVLPTSINDFVHKLFKNG